jgi:hypothetical protein
VKKSRRGEQGGEEGAEDGRKRNANDSRLYTLMKQLLPAEQIFEDYLHPALFWGIVFKNCPAFLKV